ncbi:MAG: hypothetical protein AB7S51_11775 [Porticoccaceae bacterium]
MSSELSLRWQNDWTFANASSLQFGAEYPQPRIVYVTAANIYVSEV